LFRHAFAEKGYLWRHQLADLSDIRRCIAVDLLAHCDTEITPDQDDRDGQAKMLKDFDDALKIAKWTSSAKRQAVAALRRFSPRCDPERVAASALTECDNLDNGPPEALAILGDGGRRRHCVGRWMPIVDKSVYRIHRRLCRNSVEHPKPLSDGSIEKNTAPLVSTATAHTRPATILAASKKANGH